ncbi:glutathione S-transferase [Thecamonas trahens ATCC 50062]|uniref:Glutathione S-transferase n=1 Tax=Thecamonas trahens ATCC 50062 TaxID=461836 RepID=A0A0L0D8P5_THETB|nr:glutathione S-transferase [Thecamonas trahens ATCC 50062]KNC48585.1 glutathione S-transferase [Thecamonas trahens ATCC 50062]|eukprot:XP_013762641.1 glutathione S-transferase [Thecamonas trahens ATCC 50062]
MSSSQATSEAIPTVASPARLHYFEGRGLAESVRLMLAATETEFEFVPVTTHEAFLALRDSGRLLFGQLPLLEIDGLNLVQSMAMVRYLARRGHLYGATPEDAVEADMIADSIRDALRAFTSLPFARDRTAAIDAAAAAAAKYFPRFEAILERAPASSVYFVGAKLTYPDVTLVELTCYALEVLGHDVLDAYPCLAAHHAAMVALPGIAAYLASPQRYKLGDAVYVEQVNRVLGR